MNVLVFNVDTYKSDKKKSFLKSLLYISPVIVMFFSVHLLNLPPSWEINPSFMAFSALFFYDFSSCEDILEGGLVNDSPKPRCRTNFKIHSGLIFKLLAVLP